MPQNILTYEQPLNELMRLCLRLEHLFSEFNFHLVKPESLASAAALRAIIDILTILDRPDLRGKLTKEVHRLEMSLARLQSAPDIDSTRLKSILYDIENISTMLDHTQGKLGQQLRDHPFINTVRYHSHTPAGIINADCPLHYFWVNQDHDIRTQFLDYCLTSLVDVQQIVNILLGLVRSSGEFMSLETDNAYFEKQLESGFNLQIVRIKLSKEFAVLPEISAGKHRITVHFMDIADIKERPKQARHYVPFELACCVI